MFWPMSRDAAKRSLDRAYLPPKQFQARPDDHGPRQFETRLNVNIRAASIPHSDLIADLNLKAWDVHFATIY